MSTAPGITPDESVTSTRGAIPAATGVHVAPRPRQGRRGLGAVVAIFRRRARNAPDQVNEAPQ